VCKKLGKRTVCETARRPLAGSLPAEFDEYLKETVPQLTERYRVSTDTVHHLIHYYGSRAEKVLEVTKEDPKLADRLSPESKDIYAQVLYGIREEGAKNLCDIVSRRMHLGITSMRGEPQAASIAAVAGKDLGWSAEAAKHQVEEFRAELKKEKRF
jgi:glycerol-3-phosphate dehydrogenase